MINQKIVKKGRAMMQYWKQQYNRSDCNNSNNYADNYNNDHNSTPAAIMKIMGKNRYAITMVLTRKTKTLQQYYNRHDNDRTIVTVITLKTIMVHDNC